jgi:predicted transcriptional regulator of viral defense system
MRLLDAYRKIQSLGQPVVDILDAAAALGVSRGTASKIMTRLAAAGSLIRLQGGLWALDHRIDRMLAAEYLASPALSYVSLQSALFHRGIISQIPEVTYSVTTGRTRRVRTPLGAFSFHHLGVDFFFGYETVRGVKLALPEKAVLDMLYLSPARSRLFATFPELELPRGFSVKRAREMISRIRSAQRRTLVEEKFRRLTKA